jgi:hypothetical protein
MLTMIEAALLAILSIITAKTHQITCLCVVCEVLFDQ